MLAAHRRRLTNGNYIFFNVELFNASSYGNINVTLLLNGCFFFFCFFVFFCFFYKVIDGQIMMNIKGWVSLTWIDLVLDSSNQSLVKLGLK